MDQNFSKFLQNERDRFVNTLSGFAHLVMKGLIQFSIESPFLAIPYRK